jgi:hypothetical protein
MVSSSDVLIATFLCGNCSRRFWLIRRVSVFRVKRDADQFRAAAAAALGPVEKTLREVIDQRSLSEPVAG